MKTTKSTFFMLGILSIIFFGGCDFSMGGCGTFGSTTEYDQKFVLDKEFTPLYVQVGDTLIFRPAEYAHIKFTVSKDSPCDGENYETGPYHIYPTIKTDSLATATKIYERETTDEGSYETSEVKVGIVGLTSGKTQLELIVSWFPKGYGHNITENKIFLIELNISELKSCTNKRINWGRGRSFDFQSCLF